MLAGTRKRGEEKAASLRAETDEPAHALAGVKESDIRSGSPIVECASSMSRDSPSINDHFWREARLYVDAHGYNIQGRTESMGGRWDQGMRGLQLLNVTGK
jgi:hypothetical protein